MQTWIDERSESLEQQRDLLDSLKEVNRLPFPISNSARRGSCCQSLTRSHLLLPLQAQERVELDLRDAEVRHAQAQEARDVLDADASDEAARTMQATVALREREAQNATTVARRRVLLEAQRGEEAERSKEEAERAVAAAREGKLKARERLREGQAKVRENREMMEAVQAEGFEKRVAAVMALKGSMMAVRKDLAAKNTLVQIRRRQRREEEEARFNDLLEDGQNPYEVAADPSLFSSSSLPSSSCFSLSPCLVSLNNCRQRAPGP